MAAQQQEGQHAASVSMTVETPVSVPICWGLWTGVLGLVHSAIMQPWGTLGTPQAPLLGLPQSLVAGASIPCWEMTAPS